MTQRYIWVQWNRSKKVYDLCVVLVCGAYLAAYFGVTMLVHQPPNELSPPIIAMRALGTLAIMLLHVILLIGPLARLSAVFTPLLYNRRHLGVIFFLLAMLHGLLAIGFYGGFGDRLPISAVLAPASSDFGSVSGFPFELLGFLALLIFFVMAATSHDFWLKNLSPRVWKSLHMMVYLAYGLVVLHVALGAIQAEPSPVYPALLLAGATLVGLAHAGAGIREWQRDASGPPEEDGWVDAASIHDVNEGAAAVVCLRAGERIALVRHKGALSAVSNVCAHQGGPLGEGRVLDGCLTCPWHGYQYRADAGRSPPPYTEMIPTYDLRIEGERVLVRATPNAPGTRVEPVEIPALSPDEETRA